MSALRSERLLREALGDRDELPGVEGILVAAVVVAAMLVALLFMG